MAESPDAEMSTPASSASNDFLNVPIRSDEAWACHNNGVSVADESWTRWRGVTFGKDMRRQLRHDDWDFRIRPLHKVL